MKEQPVAEHETLQRFEQRGKETLSGRRFWTPRP